MSRLLLMLVLSLTSAPAFAGFVEIGISGSYKFSGFDNNNSITSIAYTGSYSYYFLEQCALEASYTYAYNKQISKAGPTDPQYLIEDNIDMISMDLILSMGGRESVFAPYIKLGAGYLMKERYSKQDDGAKNLTSKSQGTVPSGGVGVKVNISRQLSLKLGLDAWTSPLHEEPFIVDYVGRAGISWIF